MLLAERRIQFVLNQAIDGNDITSSIFNYYVEATVE